MPGWSIADKTPQFQKDLDESYKRDTALRELPTEQVWHSRCHFYGRIINPRRPPARVLVVQAFCWRWVPATKVYFVPVHTGTESDLAEQRRRHQVSGKAEDIRKADITVLDWPTFQILFPEPHPLVAHFQLIEAVA